MTPCACVTRAEHWETENVRRLYGFSGRVLPPSVPLCRLSCAALFCFNHRSGGAGFRVLLSRRTRRCRATRSSIVAILFAAFNEQEVIVEKLRIPLRCVTHRRSSRCCLDSTRRPMRPPSGRATPPCPICTSLNFGAAGKFEVLAILCNGRVRTSWFSPMQIQFSIPNAF